jgi:pimeloyl-ACP methyl ester carboxylesterase
MTEIIDSAASKPTIVLAPRACGETSNWSLVVAGLGKVGFRVVEANIPYRGLQFDSEALLDLLRTLDGPIVLVGYDYGGMLISRFAAAEPWVLGTRPRMTVKIGTG